MSANMTAANDICLIHLPVVPNSSLSKTEPISFDYNSLSLAIELPRKAWKGSFSGNKPQMGVPVFDFCAHRLDTGKNWNTDITFSAADTESIVVGNSKCALHSLLMEHFTCKKKVELSQF